jgi:dTMP kinase
MFVTFEGLDGSGKSTQAELLRTRLERSGREVVATREPGGTPVGEAVRQLVLQGADLTAWAEAALFAAARAEHVARVIGPALDRGAVVVCDRYIDSSLAYQGAARGLGLDEVLELNLRATGGLLPDRTFLLLVDPEVGVTRLGETPDRIEREGLEFLRLVDGGYRALVERFPERIVALDGSLDREEVAERVAASLGARAVVS